MSAGDFLWAVWLICAVICYAGEKNAFAIFFMVLSFAIAAAQIAGWIA